jgi:hypothetical protein
MAGRIGGVASRTSGAGGVHRRAECGRRALEWRRQPLIGIWASRSEQKISPLSGSSRSFELKLSTWPVSQGEPGSMQAVLEPTAAIQLRTAWATNSGPLSERMCSGTPRSSLRSAKLSRASAEPGADLLGGLPATRGADYFPDKAPLRMSLSSVRSETAFLRRLFSNSSSFRRRTWSSLSPPNSLRQRW